MIFLLWLSCLVLLLVVSGLPQSITHQQAHLCATLTSLSLQNTVIWEASHVPAFSNISYPGLCHYNVVNAVDFCRVYGEISTSSVSSVRFEVWLPDTWYGRLLSTGNLGLGGCIDYGNLVYGSSLNFATVAGNGGHVEPNVGGPFYHRPEVVKDFSYRSVHITTVIGKQIAEAYYSKFPSTSYYLSCSNGGRQGVQSALLYPDDFDGIIAGSPALDWNHFIGSGGITADYVGPPGSDRFIPSSLWPLVTREVLKQCDELDGLPDGTIAEPDDCRFDPSPLTCADGQVGDCLTETQTEGLRMLYGPIYGSRGQFLWPRFDPVAELDTSLGGPMDGQTPSADSDWMKYAIYNNSKHVVSASDIEFADTINLADISTWNGNLSAFRDRGGKLLTYHGRSDVLVTSGNSKRFYELVSSTLSLASLDDFYRLFLVPGMFHCVRGGAWAFGQGTFLGATSNVINDTNHNVLLAMVDWVEGGKAPETIIGLDDRFGERAHCRYPHKSLWNGSRWICE